MPDRKLNAVIIDDDANSRKLLQILLRKFPQINIVGEASDVSRGLEVIKRTNPDGIFLDICLDDETGFELMKRIESNPKIVFVSAYDNYALKAFDVNALDYLQKPIAAERLAQTIEKLLNSFDRNGNDSIDNNRNGQNGYGKNGNGKNNSYNIGSENRTAILESETADEDVEISEDDDNDFDVIRNDNSLNKVLEYDDRLFITSDGISKFIKINNILCITAEKDYSYIYLNTGKKHLVLKSMVEWEERLTPKYFVRIHRSTIVNLEFIEKVEKWFNSSYHVHLLNHQQPFKMSRRYAAKLKEKFK